MNPLSLMFPNDNIPNSGTRHEIEHSISISALRLLITASLRSFIALHLAVKHLTRHDILGIFEDDCFFGDRELGDGEGEAWWWSLAEIALGCICVALCTVTGFGLAGGDDGGVGEGEDCEEE